MADFRRLGSRYRPDSRHIKVLALTAGDTLVMPPGTIHGPITVTDCLLQGGMVMQKRQMRRSMRAWRFCAENGRCTNEEQPRQTRSILDYFRRQFHLDHTACGYTDENKSEFDADLEAIAGISLSCRCKGSCCKKACGCYSSAQRCGPKCHRGRAGRMCDNIFGCEAGKLVHET
jgi:hypothetical protein